MPEHPKSYGRVASAVLLAVVVVLFGSWWFFVRAPAPEVVCDHVLQVTLREAQAQGLGPESQGALVEKLRRGCIQHKLDKIQLRGRIAYARLARCILEHDTRAEIDACK